MKTFRLVSLHLLLNAEGKITQKIIPLQQGLIINREEKDGTWLIEAVVSNEHKEFFDKRKETEETMVLEVLITDEKNEPALFVGQVKDTVELSEHISVMISATITTGKDDVSSLILEDLINDGFSGKELLQEFANRKEDQAQWSKKLAENIYNNLE
ncbi:YwpF-like family protein [Bacillus piscicola]|uniref:YwpF-like family protein n=1 Tax=Bacillus piscicola TaxID=1632684 RepID=UPI001F0891C0|nr:YwpF-like family protein [Bacillus piscicola]